MSTEKTSTRPRQYENGFYFQRPELEGRLDVATEHVIALGALASRQALEFRTRTYHPDGRAENVAEHSHMLSRVATGLVRRFRDRLPESIDEGRVGLYADIHDDVEAYVCDTATDFISEEGLRQKALREAAGARQLYLEYNDIDPIYAGRLMAYEEQSDPSARFVRLVDKFMTLLIHIPNKGAIVRETYGSRQFFLDGIYSHSQRLREQYPEFAWLLEYRNELGEYVANLAFPDDA